MFGAVLVAWLHYLSILFFAGMLVSQIYVLKLGPSADSVAAIARIDRVFGISALAVLLTGLGRIPLAHGGKGMDYYLGSGAFHGSLALFVVGALVSLKPTIRYLRWRREAAAGRLPDAQAWKGTQKFVHIQLSVMSLIALLMPIVAKGLG